jgi:hypothetical protein
MMDRPFGFAIRSQLCSAAALLVAAGAIGCHGEVVPVSGRVTLDGKPLADAVVTFQPLGHGKAMATTTTGSVGKTDSDGRFRLRLVSPERNGAAVGDHFITISAPPGETDGAPTNDDLSPLAWRDGSRQFRVPSGGTREANFDIKAEPPPKVDEAKGIPGKKKRGR